MTVIVDARRLSKEARGLLIANAIRKVGSGEILVLADDDKAREEVACTAGNHGWRLKGIQSQGDHCRITITQSFGQEIHPPDRPVQGGGGSD